MSTIQWKNLVSDDTPVRRAPEAFVRMVWAVTPRDHAVGLTPQREAALVTRVQRKNDQSALAELLAAHERMLVKTARKVARQNGMRSHIHDLVQTAYLAFSEAVHRYNADGQARLSTFSRYSVTGELLKHALDFRHAVPIGRGSDERKAYYHARAAIDAFTQQNGRAPDTTGNDLGNLAERLGVSPKAMKRGANARDMRTISLDTIEAWDTDTPTLEDVDVSRVEAILHAARTKTLGKLSSRDRAIAQAFFEDPEGFKAVDFADRFSITPERVGQVRRQAVAVMRRHLEAMGLTADVLAS